MPHIRLFIPGPTEVRPEILDAQTSWMIGHRMPECAELFGRIQGKLRQVFMTDKRVYVSASSGTGLQEAAVRNCSDRKILNCVNGAFADRWRQVTEAKGKDNDVLTVEWGQPVRPEQVAERLRSSGFDAITVVHNETSTGAVSPIAEIARAVRSAPGGEDIMILVDSVKNFDLVRGVSEKVGGEVRDEIRDEVEEKKRRSSRTWIQQIKKPHAFLRSCSRCTACSNLKL